jgi:hypothetical protein
MEEKGYESLRSFYLEPIDNEGYDIPTAIEEVTVEPMPATKTNRESKVRYYNLNGHESNRSFDGVNIEVTTDNGNTRSARKIIRSN